MMNGNSAAARAARSDKTPITIKKYANRRLYNTATSSYVTLDNLADMVKTGADFVVYDAKSGEDITRSVLTHIIVEEESKGQKLLPVSFLRHLISFYGDSLQVVVPRYLEHTMHSFARNQEKMRDYMRDAFDGLLPFGQFEEMSKQNLAIFERALRMFVPLYGESETASTPSEEPRTVTSGEIEDLRAQLAKMQDQLNALASSPTKG